MFDNYLWAELTTQDSFAGFLQVLIVQPSLTIRMSCTKMGTLN